MKIEKKALVVLSGGQDSITCLGLAINTHKKVSAISFDYGQRHKVELECAKAICSKYSIPHVIIDIQFFGDMVTSALLDATEVNRPHPNKKDLPASFVPNRNALFLTLAHAHAQEIEAEAIYAGMCQTDYSGYPDCREVFVRAMEASLNTGYETSIVILTPLMFLTKAETFACAANVDFLNDVLEGSHTCYNGDHETWNDWGYGCGTCPACELREKGFAEFIGEVKND